MRVIIRAMTLADALRKLDSVFAELKTRDQILHKRDAELEQRDSKIARIENENAGLEERVTVLQSQLNDLMHRLYGRRSERFEVPGQQDLFDSLMELTQEAAGETQSESAADVEDISYRRKKPKPRGKKPLPEHLERVRIAVDPSASETTCACCQGQMKRVGEVITEELDIVPQKFFVKQYVQGKFCCEECMNRSVMKELPPRPIQHGRPSPGVLAYIIVSKYVDHLPLYRQEKIFKRQGVSIVRSTMNGWLDETAKLLASIAGALKRDLLRDPFLQVDETTIQVMHPEVKGKTKRCYIWAYARPGREVFYEFTESRSGQHPAKVLCDFNGTLQTDGFSGYNALWKRGVRHVACMAHIRRGFFQARKEKPTEVAPIIAVIGRLHRLERLARTFGVTGARLVELRKRRARPLFEKLEGHIDTLAKVVLPKSKLGKAITYARGQWQAMLHYIEVPEAPLGRVEDRRGDFRPRGVAVFRRLSSSAGASILTMAPFPVPARRTGRADFPHPALIQFLQPSHSSGRDATVAA